MAIDSAAKRRSILSLLQPWRGIAVIPDGTIGQADRQALLFLYSGIAAEEAVVSVTSRAFYRPGSIGIADVRLGSVSSSDTRLGNVGVADTRIGTADEQVM